MKLRTLHYGKYDYFASGTDLEKIISRANNVLHLLKRSNERKCLSTNTTKTKAVLFNPRNSVITLNTNLYLDGHRINFVHVVKLIGAFLSHDVTCYYNIDNIRTKTK